MMMHKRNQLLVVVVLGMLFASTTIARGDDFNSVVKLIEKYYGVKHHGLPFLAKAALKVAKPVGKITGGEIKRLSEFGSVKVATFEDQTFKGDVVAFRSSLNGALVATWNPLVQTISKVDEEQAYIFVREAGEKFDVLVVSIDSGDGAVVQATLSAKSLAELIKDPENASKKLSREAIVD